MDPSETSEGELHEVLLTQFSLGTQSHLMIAAHEGSSRSGALKCAAGCGSGCPAGFDHWHPEMHRLEYVNVGSYGGFPKWGYPEKKHSNLDQFSIETYGMGTPILVKIKTYCLKPHQNVFPASHPPLYLFLSNKIFILSAILVHMSMFIYKFPPFPM